MMENIDIELYDRQIRALGLSETIKLGNISVMIIGLQGGLATEICKNLILSNINKLYLVDSNTITEQDLETGYLYNTESIGLHRSVILAKNLRTINSNINIYSCDSYKGNQNITIIINQDINYTLEINEYCRINNIKSIVLFSGGISGVIFVDIGEKHEINTINNDNINSIQIGTLSCNGTIICAHNYRHNYQTGDIIRLNNLDGINVIQFQKEWSIEVINSYTFKLNNFEYDAPFTLYNGEINYVNKIIQITHEPLKKQIINKSINSSLNKSYDYNLIDTFIQMYTDRLIDKMPFIWSLDNSTFMNNNNIILQDHARTFNLELMPIVSIFGSLIATEIIKIMTNKFIPITQWYVWSDKTLIPKNKPDDCNHNSIYGILYGSTFEQKLQDTNVFIIGAGSIGCEHLKNITFLNKIKNILITDYDIIHKSNLSNQFLFNNNDINKHKSYIAANTIKKIKPNINIVYAKEKADVDNSNFMNLFLNNISNNTCIFNAIDNIPTRKFIDELCFKYNIPLFDAGFDGFKGHVQPIVPYITETYSASQDPNYDYIYPACVIKNFPNNINHIIQWSIEQFKIFQDISIILNDLNYNKYYIDTLSENDKNTAHLYLYKLLVKYPIECNKRTETNLIIAVRYSIDLFIENYYSEIVKLLEIYKPNHEISSNILFWSSGKKCPNSIKLDITNKLHIKYIKLTTRILFEMCNSYYEFDNDIFIQIIKDYTDTINYNNLLNIQSQVDITKINYDKIQKYTIIQTSNNKLYIDWITVATNLRALNYKINEQNEFTIKGIVEQIIPVIVSTSSMISGLTILEFLKYILDSSSNIYNCNFINVIEPIIISAKPINAPLIEIGNVKINSWQKFEYTENTTLLEFKLYYESLFNTKINMIVYFTTILYADFINDKLDKYLNELINNEDNISSFILLAEDESKNLPIINIIIN